MNLNMDSILQFIQELRSQLEIWGIDSEALLVLGGIAFVLFVLSLREVATWYFRVNQVRDEVQTLRAQVQALDTTLKEIALSLKDPQMAKDLTTPPLGKEDLLKIAEGMRNDTPSTKRFTIRDC